MFSILLKKLGAGLISGLLGGLLLGIGARLIMRILALIAGQAPAFSIEGSLGILLIGLLIGLVSGLAFSALTAYLPDFKWKGMAFDLVILAILAPLMPAPIQAEIAAAAVGGRLGLMIVLFAVMFSIFGLVLQSISMRMLKPGVQRSA